MISEGRKHKMHKITVDLQVLIRIQNFFVDIEAQIGDVRIPKYPINERDSSTDDTSDNNTPHESMAVTQEKYRRKYIKLKRKIKDLVFVG